jgi:beta-phosphoglucomutase-like phosphatase (HAD superfamily)
MPLGALIFDVDGTLADTEELHRQAFNAAFAQHDLPWHWAPSVYAGLLQITGGKERLAHFIQLTTWATAAHLADLIPVIHATKTKIYTEMVASGRAPLREAVEDLIKEARSAGIRLAIASTTTPGNIRALIAGTLGTTALDWFDLIAAGDDVAHKKPAPEIYLFALERLRLPAASCLAFEDSANGLAAAKGAGLCTVATPTYWTANDDFGAADLLLEGLGEAGGLGGLRSFHSNWLLRTVVAA